MAARAIPRTWQHDGPRHRRSSRAQGGRPRHFHRNDPLAGHRADGSSGCLFLPSRKQIGTSREAGGAPWSGSRNCDFWYFRAATRDQNLCFSCPAEIRRLTYACCSARRSDGRSKRCRSCLPGRSAFSVHSGGTGLSLSLRNVLYFGARFGGGRPSFTAATEWRHTRVSQSRIDAVSDSTLLSSSRTRMMQRL
jgi:hypothetical protein